MATLRDHFQEKLQAAVERADPFDHPPQAIKDDWALLYIDVKWMDRILEAFDEDSSGFVTIMEINRFTRSLPGELNWR